jgi:Kdo2-lipid IVA lauroyltransferase/acyltransferase
MSRAKSKAIHHPVYWPLWAGLGLFRLLILLPWRVQLALGRIFGRIGFLFLPGRRRVVKVNLRLCFPELSGAEIDRLASAHYQAIGIGLFETCVAWWGPVASLPKHRIVGAEHLENAIGNGRGVILFTAHFTTLELCGRMFAAHFPMGGLYRTPDNPVVAREMHRGRIDKMTAAVPMDDLRGLIRALKQGHTMWYAPDQAKRSKLSTLLPFFGEPALTNTATSRLAGMTKAAVVPFFPRRLPDGTYLLEILPALENFPTADADTDAIRTNQLMEKYIREAPEQYFWVHRRFKRRGKEFQDVYR